MSRRHLVLQSLGLAENDKRIPVHKVNDRLFEDCSNSRWSLMYTENGILLQNEVSGEQRRAANLSDLVVFYSEHEFSLYLRKVSDGKLC